MQSQDFIPMPYLKGKGESRFETASFGTRRHDVQGHMQDCIKSQDMFSQDKDPLQGFFVATHLRAVRWKKSREKELPL